jgi:hypothetical protein
MAEGQVHAFVASHKNRFLLPDSDAEVLRIGLQHAGATGIVDMGTVRQQD